MSSDTKFFVTFFTSVDVTFYDWCIITVVLLVSHISLITICYHNLTLLLKKMIIIMLVITSFAISPPKFSFKLFHVNFFDIKLIQIDMPKTNTALIITHSIFLQFLETIYLQS